MRRIAAGKRGAIPREFTVIVLAASLIMTASTLTGCANQKLSDDAPELKPSNARQFRSKSTHAATPANSKPSAQQSATSPASSEPASNETAHTGGLIQPAPIADLPVAYEPRTMRAMNCRELMLKEHPTVRFGSNGNATAQRDFFDGCMKRTGTEP